jgi:hypothetical protein
MYFSLNSTNVAFLFLAWAFFLGLVGFSLTAVPTWFMIVATVLYLVVTNQRSTPA